MNTTHYKEPTEQNEKQKDGLLLDAISLRDYFAAKAMQATLIDHKLKNFDDYVVSKIAYQMADAMLEVREK